MPPQFVFMQNGFEDKLKSTDKLGEPHIGSVQAAAATLSNNIKTFNAVYCSPNYSSIHTAALVGEFCSIDALYVADYLVDRQDLNLARAANEIIIADWPTLNTTLLDAEPDVWTMQEPLKFVENRVILFLQKLIEQYENSDSNVLIITHHAVLFCLFAGLRFSPCETMCLDCDELRELL